MSSSASRCPPPNGHGPHAILPSPSATAAFQPTVALPSTSTSAPDLHPPMAGSATWPPHASMPASVAPTLHGYAAVDTPLAGVELSWDTPARLRYGPMALSSRYLCCWQAESRVPRVDQPNWMQSPDAITTHDLVSHKVEQIRLKCCRFMVDLCRALKFPCRTATTAQLFFHRFFTTPDKSMSRHKPFDVAILAVSVASKGEDTIKKLPFILQAAHELLMKGRRPTSSPTSQGAISLESPELEAWKLRLLSMELDFLEAQGFQFAVPNAHKAAIAIAKHLQLSQDLTFEAWLLSVDAYRSTVVLMYPFQLVALASIYISMLLPRYHAHVVQLSLPEKWFFHFLPVADEFLLDAASKILDVRNELADVLSSSERAKRSGCSPTKDYQDARIAINATLAHLKRFTVDREHLSIPVVPRPSFPVAAESPVVIQKPMELPLPQSYPATPVVAQTEFTLVGSYQPQPNPQPRPYQGPRGGSRRSSANTSYPTVPQFSGGRSNDYSTPSPLPPPPPPPPSSSRPTEFFRSGTQSDMDMSDEDQTRPVREDANRHRSFVKGGFQSSYQRNHFERPRDTSAWNHQDSRKHSWTPKFQSQKQSQFDKPHSYDRHDGSSIISKSNSPRTDGDSGSRQYSDRFRDKSSTTYREKSDDYSKNSSKYRERDESFRKERDSSTEHRRQERHESSSSRTYRNDSADSGSRAESRDWDRDSTRKNRELSAEGDHRSSWRGQKRTDYGKRDQSADSKRGQVFSEKIASDERTLASRTDSRYGDGSVESKSGRVSAYQEGGRSSASRTDFIHRDRSVEPKRGRVSAYQGDEGSSSVHLKKQAEFIRKRRDLSSEPRFNERRESSSSRKPREPSSDSHGRTESRDRDRVSSQKDRGSSVEAERRQSWRSKKSANSRQRDLSSDAHYGHDDLPSGNKPYVTSSSSSTASHHLSRSRDSNYGDTGKTYVSNFDRKKNDRSPEKGRRPAIRSRKPSQLSDSDLSSDGSLHFRRKRSRSR